MNEREEGYIQALRDVISHMDEFGIAGIYRRIAGWINWSLTRCRRCPHSAEAHRNGRCACCSCNDYQPRQVGVSDGTHERNIYVRTDGPDGGSTAQALVLGAEADAAAHEASGPRGCE